MASTKPRALIAATYEEAAREYIRNLPLEHFTEATAQATQRKITLESLDLVTARRADVHVVNELLVQYPRPGQRKPGQVVPDNMVVISEQALEPQTSYNLPLEPADLRETVFLDEPRDVRETTTGVGINRKLHIIRS